MGTLEKIAGAYSADLEKLNAHIESRLQSGNALMSRIVLSLLRTKGKQLRPLLLIMCARMFGPVDEKVIAAAAAVELIHNASLIHDDVVDNSPTRRGNPTVNAVWDNHIAVLVGDFFTSTAMQEAISTADIRIIDALCRLGRQLSLGEIDQIYNARQHTLDEEGYYRIVDYKTASLFEASARMGCYAADAPDEACAVLTRYASLFGRCFQIRDDIFDYFTDKNIGKPTCNDLREGKITLPLLHVLLDDSLAAHDEMLALSQKELLDDEDIERLVDFAVSNGGIDYAFAEMKRLRDRGADILATFPKSEASETLLKIFDYIIEREY